MSFIKLDTIRIRTYVAKRVFVYTENKDQLTPRVPQNKSTHID